MRAKITKIGGYMCSPTGHTVETFDHGCIVEGQVAEWALQDHAAARIMEPKPETAEIEAPHAPDLEAKVTGPSETKPKRTRGRPRKDAK